MAFLSKLVFVVGVAAALIVVLAFFGQRHLLYFPDRTRTEPGAVGLNRVTEHLIAAPDGTLVVTWWAKAQAGQPTLIYFHGNAGALVARAPRFERFMAEGWGVLMMSYRGFSGSTGRPTETNNVADAIRTYDWAVTGGVDARSIVFYGESLGTGVAVQAAVARPAAGLILDAPYTSTVDVGARQFPFLPVRWAMWDRYETAKHIGGVTAPLLVLHGAKDTIIPVAMGREVARLANPPKTYVEFPNGGHINLYVEGNNALDAVRAFMRQLGFPRAS
jgi:uncharacterized protein